MRNLLLATALMLTALTANAQKKEIAVLSFNDMHATIDAFPQIADAIDSLRGIYPELLVLSAGDNRTGNAYNDQYRESSYPMTILMNTVGFKASAVGNHEFDNKPSGLRRQMQRSNFPYLCANMQAHDSLGLNIRPYHFFEVEGVKVCVLGVIQLGALGIPDCHPANCVGISFTPADETIKQYEWLRKECDVMLLLSHNGYEADVETAGKYPWIDAILGGHTHTPVPANDMHNGVLVVQNKNKLKTGASLVKLTIEGGKVTGKSSEIIDILHRQGKNEVVQSMLSYFYNNEALARKIAVAEQAFSTVEEFGCLMTDAVREESGADISLQNGGGVRLSEFPAGPITVGDVLRLDPFGNTCCITTMTGQQVVDFIRDCRDKDEQQIPYVSGIKYTIELNPDDKFHCKSVTVTNLDGSKFNLKKKYRVATNSYVNATLSTFDGEDTLIPCSDLLMRYLEKKGTVDYKGRSCVTVK